MQSEKQCKLISSWKKKHFGREQLRLFRFTTAKDQASNKTIELAIRLQNRKIDDLTSYGDRLNSFLPLISLLGEQVVIYLTRWGTFREKVGNLCMNNT